MQIRETNIGGQSLSIVEDRGDRRVRVIGKGAREHSWLRLVLLSPQVSYADIAPGNAGTKNHNIPISETNIEEQVRDAKARGIDTVIVGPEDPLALGIVDRLNEAGIYAFGPKAAEAQLEADKWFAIQILKAAGVLHPETHAFSDKQSAKAYVRKRGYENTVGKERGLKAGKGVTVWNSLTEADETIEKVFKDPQLYLIQDRIQDAFEASFMAFVDGEHIIPMLPSQDYKRIGENDTGPNTGDMGAIAPTPRITAELNTRIMNEVMEPIILEMRKRGMNYKGVLYVGLMIDKNGNIYTTDTNVRKGDPEGPVESILLEKDVDIIEVIDAVRNGTLESKHIRYVHNMVALGMVVASPGYPIHPQVGHPITGLDQQLDENSFLFHAGTKVNGDLTETNGGRVAIGIGRGKDFKEAKKRATMIVEQIIFEGKQSREDIGNSVIYQS